MDILKADNQKIIDERQSNFDLINWKSHKNYEIVKMTGFPEGTVCNFKRQKSEIKQAWVLQKVF